MCCISYSFQFIHGKYLQTYYQHEDINIIRNLYWDQTASVRIMNELSDDIRIQRGVRQGCVAYPTHFNLYTDNICRHIINMKGVNGGGKH